MTVLPTLRSASYYESLQISAILHKSPQSSTSLRRYSQVITSLHKSQQASTSLHTQVFTSHHKSPQVHKATDLAHNCSWFCHFQKSPQVFRGLHRYPQVSTSLHRLHKSPQVQVSKILCKYQYLQKIPKVDNTKDEPHRE